MNISLYEMNVNIIIIANSLYNLIKISIEQKKGTQKNVPVGILTNFKHHFTDSIAVKKKYSPVRL